jgi:hypothetical protein
MIGKRRVEPELVVEQVDLAFRVLDDMERFLDERHLPAGEAPAPDRAELTAFRDEIERGLAEA